MAVVGSVTVSRKSDIYLQDEQLVFAHTLSLSWCQDMYGLPKVT